MKFYYFPLSTYGQKTLMALYEKNVDFEAAIVDLRDENQRDEYKKVYPLGKIPLLVRDDGWLIPESTIIIEYIDTHFGSGPQLIPEDKDKARQVRFMDRMSDLYVNESVTTLLFQGWKPEAERDQQRIESAQFRAGVMYDYLNKTLEGKEWLMGEFSMADCAVAPPLLYAQRIFPFDGHANIVSYWERVQSRPSYRKVLAEAQPYLDALNESAA
jgi:glutathione S-transferase